jgi:hypothetical protein
VRVLGLRVTTEEVSVIENDLRTSNIQGYVLMKIARDNLTVVGFILQFRGSELTKWAIDRVQYTNYALGEKQLAAWTVEQEIERQSQIRRQAEAVQEQKKAAAVRARERAEWPIGTVAKLVEGAPVCIDYRSALKASIILRSGNDMLSLPDECLIAADTKFLREAQDLGGEITKIRITGATIYGFTSTRHVRY